METKADVRLNKRYHIEVNMKYNKVNLYSEEKVNNIKTSETKLNPSQTQS